NGEHLHGYNAEEVKIIALLARHHRKKILKLNHDSLSEFTDEMKHKLRVLCTIIRLSAVLKEIQSLSVPHVELSRSQDCFKLVVRDDSSSPSANEVQSIPEAINVELRKELNHFEEVFQQKLSVVVFPSRTHFP
nr:Ppx/GppA phosphatase [Tanacetum cinerariifolium]